ncbi:MAG TPA: SDR family oxidoreductase [Candidatus Binatia bacterium]|nr:SDR family oxidoreductase [Candidatus Binatia bacterium]
MEIKDKVALVTGGATGIGRATVLAFAQAGAAGVAINYRSAKAEAEKLANEVNQAGAEPLLVQGDVKNEADVRRMVGDVDKRFRRLDILVNNAGVTHWVPVKDIQKLTDEIWDDILDVNLKGAFRCVRAAAALLENSRGVVINVASISGVLAPATMSSLAYGTAKAALIYLTRGLAVALAPNVRVNGVAPAFTDTPWMEKHYANNYDEVMAKAAEGYPLKRVARPEDIAAAILGLITGGDFVTGQTLLVDGGLSLS